MHEHFMFNPSTKKSELESKTKGIAASKEIYYTELSCSLYYLPDILRLICHKPWLSQTELEYPSWEWFYH